MLGFSKRQSILAVGASPDLLAAAGARLARPALTAAVAHWRGDWEAERMLEERRKRMTSDQKAQKEAEALRAELKQLQEDFARQTATAKAAQEKALAPPVGTKLRVRFDDDGGWYDGVVQTSVGSAATVFFAVDGTVEEISFPDEGVVVVADAEA